MPGTLQQYLAEMAGKAAEDLIAALDRLPAEKRQWKPSEKSRSAMNQFAECAILNGSTAKLIRDRSWDTQGSMDDYFDTLSKMEGDEAAVRALMQENLPKIKDAILSVPDEDLSKEVQMPWGPMTLKQIVGYPFWNMCYHEGQINYIAMMSGVEIGPPV